jgi:cytochrome c oxidase assembly protein subunit 15
MRIGAGVIVALALLQIFLGGLVAGLDAGLTFNTWPLMDGTIVPSGLFVQEPWWRNLFENVATVQFDHRLGAYVLLAATIAHAYFVRRTAQATGAQQLAFLVLLQAALGIATLLNAAPLPLALLHQLGAVAVLSFAVTYWRGLFLARAIPEQSFRPAPASG